MLQVRAISKVYESAAGPVPVLEDVNLDLPAGSAISIMGPSGSGKSTLLQILGLLDPPTSGQYLFDGVEPWLLREAEQARFRNSNSSTVFGQSFPSSRESARSAKSLPPVWHWGQ